MLTDPLPMQTPAETTPPRQAKNWRGIGAGIACWPFDWRWGKGGHGAPAFKHGFALYAGPFVLWAEWPRA